MNIFHLFGKIFHPFIGKIRYLCNKYTVTTINTFNMKQIIFFAALLILIHFKSPEAREHFSEVPGSNMKSQFPINFVKVKSIDYLHK